MQPLSPLKAKKAKKALKCFSLSGFPLTQWNFVKTIQIFELIFHLLI